MSEDRGRNIYFEPLGRRVREYVAIFWTANGPGPWPCHFCNHPVTRLGKPDGVVHHLDHDHENQDLDNLAAAHWRCHASHHGRDRSLTPAARSALDRTGTSPSPETRAKLREALRQEVPEAVAFEIRKRHANGETYRSLMKEFRLSQRKLQRALGHDR